MYQVEDDDIRIYQLPNADTVSATMKVVVDSLEDGTKSLFANKLMMKPSTGVTSNNLAAFSPSGDIKDSGTSVEDFATAEQGRKADTAVQSNDITEVAFTGRYDSLVDKPYIPEPQVKSDWDETDPTSISYIDNKPGVISKEEILALED